MDGFVQHKIEFKANQVFLGFKLAEKTLCTVISDLLIFAIPSLLLTILTWTE